MRATNQQTNIEAMLQQAVSNARLQLLATEGALKAYKNALGKPGQADAQPGPAPAKRGVKGPKGPKVTKPPRKKRHNRGNTVGAQMRAVETREALLVLLLEGKANQTVGELAKRIPLPQRSESHIRGQLYALIGEGHVVRLVWGHRGLLERHVFGLTSSGISKARAVQDRDAPRAA